MGQYGAKEWTLLSEKESEKERTFKCTSLTEHSCVIH